MDDRFLSSLFGELMTSLEPERLPAADPDTGLIEETGPVGIEKLDGWDLRRVYRADPAVTARLERIQAAAGRENGILVPWQTQGMLASGVPLRVELYRLPADRLTLRQTYDQLARWRAAGDTARLQSLLRVLTRQLARLHQAGVVHQAVDLGHLLLGGVTEGSPWLLLALPPQAFLVGEAQVPPVRQQQLNLCSPEAALYCLAAPAERRAVPGMIGTESDIFSLGLLFHQVLTGKLPRVNRLPRALTRGWPAPPWLAALSCQEEPECHFVLDEETLSPAMCVLIRSMLAADPSDRPTAQQLVELLEQHGSGEFFNRG